MRGAAGTGARPRQRVLLGVRGGPSARLVDAAPEVLHARGDRRGAAVVLARDADNKGVAAAARIAKRVGRTDGERGRRAGDRGRQASTLAGAARRRQRPGRHRARHGAAAHHAAVQLHHAAEPWHGAWRTAFADQGPMSK